MNKGFTLVELLAVIVILAVLALIATPVVLSIIDDTKESAMLRSGEMYLSGVENAVMRENMNSGGNFRPNECTISNGNITCGSTNVEVEVDGEVPSTGTIVFENGKIKEVTLNYTSGTIIKDSNGELVYEDSDEETLAPGLYAENGTMTYSWQQLIDNGIIYITDGVLMSNIYENGGWNQNVQDTLSGELVIPDSITSIGSFAFAECINLNSVTIPSTITSIGQLSLSRCDSLIVINYQGTMEQWNSIQFGSEWNYGCPEITVHCTDGDITI